MNIKDYCLEVVKDMVHYTPIKQKDIINEISLRCGYGYESVRGSTFRSKHNIPEVYENYECLKIKRLNYWVKRDIKKEFKVEYIKPKEYQMGLDMISDNKVYTLSGVTQSCYNYLKDKCEVIRVDNQKHIECDIRTNILNIIDDNSNCNLDFEGILTENKIDRINKLKFNKILLTFRCTYKDDTLFKKLKTYNHRMLKKYNSNGHSMVIYILNRN